MTSETFRNVVEKLSSRTMSWTIVGARGSGKSCLGFKLMDEFHKETGRKCFLYKFPESLTDYIPSYFESVDSLEEVPMSGLLYVDEGARDFNARKNRDKSNMDLTDDLIQARHMDIPTIIVTQQGSLLEINALRFTDAFLLKQPSFVQLEFERPVFKKLYKPALAAFSKLRLSDDELNKYFYLRSSFGQGLGEFEAPEFWTDDISKSARHFKNAPVCEEDRIIQVGHDDWGKALEDCGKFMISLFDDGTKSGRRKK